MTEIEQDADIGQTDLLQATYMRNLPVSGVHLLGTNSLGQHIFWRPGSLRARR